MQIIRRLFSVIWSSETFSSRLQLAQNCAARLILCGHKHDHVTPLLRELHWLPVEQRIIFKILFFTFKALNNLCPSYISDL